MTLPMTWSSRGRIAALAIAAVAVTTAVAAAGSAQAAPTRGEIVPVGTAAVVPDSYIVVLNDTAALRSSGVPAAAADLTDRYGGTVGHVYQHALKGFEVSIPQAAAQRLATNSAVAYVQQNGVYTISGTQSPTPSWGLDRIDQRNLPLNNSYTYPVTASGVRAYIIDTGILFGHNDFGGRAVSGYDAVDGGTADDCNGHGTHVAGTTGGTSYGVAKGVTLVGVRVLNCSGSGTTAGVVAGVDWATGDHDPGEPAVANMSLGGGADSALDTAVNNSINDGITYAIAAGNSSANACNYSPARVAAAITVGATESTDARASYSNYGTCLDIFAPGSGITSAWYTSNTATNTISGTSMATPHVAGAAALVLAQNTSFTPAEVRNYLVNNATSGVVTNPGTGSPNLLLFVVNGGTPPPTDDFSISVSPTSGSTTAGGSVTATVSTTTTSGSPQTVGFSASGLPSGATATFSPSSVTSGGSSTMTISTSTSTPAGTYPITITGSGTSATHTTPYSLTVTGGGGGGCTGTNGTNVTIPDNTTVESSITISGCAGTASASSTVEVHIVHTYIGDLIVNLVAPDGTLYLLHNRSGGGTDNINQTYTVNLSSETANGTWRLRVQDAASLDTGYIDTWTLNLAGGGGGTCTGTNGTNVTIPDNTTVESSITISGCSGNASSTSTVEVHIVHTYIGDLVVNLVAPDGTLYLLHNRSGGGTDNINQTYTVNLSSEPRNGTWRLRVQDAASLDTGYVDSWTLTL